MIKAALALANVTGKPDYIERARAWADVLDKHYWAENLGGYYFAADDTDDLIVRAIQRPGRGDAERERHDGVEPDGALSLDRRGALPRARRGDPAAASPAPCARNVLLACRAARRRRRSAGAGAYRARSCRRRRARASCARALADVSLPNAVVQEVRAGDVSRVPESRRRTARPRSTASRRPMSASARNARCR